MTNTHSCKIPVLMYHAIEDVDHPAGAKDPGEQLYVLSRDSFYAQMEYLSLNDFTVLSFDDLSKLDEWPEKGIVITFDDGHQSNYTLALPILEQFGFHAHFFITTDWIDTPHFLTSSQVKQLVDHRMSIGSHGVTHSFFSDMDEKEIEKELKQSKAVLQENTLSDITTFSAPGGRMHPNLFKIGCNYGFNHYFTSEFDFFKNKSSTRIIPRFAIKGKMDLNTFKKIIEGDSVYFFLQQGKTRALNIIKKFIGNVMYEKIRNVIFS